MDNSLVGMGVAQAYIGELVQGDGMSTKGVYTALSGAMAQSLRLDTISNNLANVNTPGFKKDDQTFQEYVTANEKPGEVIQVPRVPSSIESFYDMQGGDKAYVDASGTHTNFEQGSLKSTGSKLDVAIDGQGFFEIYTPQGIRLSRVGAFKLDGNGQLVTKDGYPVMKTAGEGQDPETRAFKFGGDQPISIGENGDVYEGDEIVGRLSVVDVANKSSLQKIGGSLFDFKKNMKPEITTVQNPSVKQGFLEMSNVNVVQEMTNMISTTRVFESTQKAISAYDSMADKLINVVGSVK